MAKPQQKQIMAAAVLWKDANDQRRWARDQGIDTADYFDGKAFAVSETFAAMFDMTWTTADDMLRKRSAVL